MREGRAREGKKRERDVAEASSIPARGLSAGREKRGMIKTAGGSPTKREREREREL